MTIMPNESILIESHEGGTIDAAYRGFGNVMCTILRDEVRKALQKKQALPGVDINKIIDFVIDHNVWITDNDGERYEHEDGQVIINHLKKL